MGLILYLRFIFSTRCNIYILRLCYNVSVRLSVTEVHFVAVHAGKRGGVISTTTSRTMLATVRSSCILTDNIVTRISVCQSAHISLKPHVQTSPSFSATIACGRDLILFWWCCNKLCTSVFVSDVMFSYNGPYGDVTLLQQPCCSVNAQADSLAAWSWLHAVRDDVGCQD